MELTLGERIRKARKGRMTQAELANTIGVHEITVRRWELGERTPDVRDLQKIAQAVDISVGELLGNNDTASEGELPSTVSHMRQQSNKEHSINRGMLVYEANGERFEAPPTDMGIRYIERMRALINMKPAIA